MFFGISAKSMQRYNLMPTSDDLSVIFFITLLQFEGPGVECDNQGCLYRPVCGCPTSIPALNMKVSGPGKPLQYARLLYTVVLLAFVEALL